jgi:hypothetical protein
MYAKDDYPEYLALERQRLTFWKTETSWYTVRETQGKNSTTPSYTYLLLPMPYCCVKRRYPK